METIPILERAIDQRLTRVQELNKRTDLTESEQSEVANLRQELTDKQNQLEQRRWMATLEKDNAKPESPDIANAKKQYSLRKAILSQLPNSKIDAGLEKEVSQQMTMDSGKHTDGLWAPVEQRTVTTTTPSAGAGGSLVGTRHLGSSFINLLRPSLLSTQLPFTRLSAKQNLSIPKAKATAPTSKFIGETDAITSGDAQFESISVSPSRAGALTEYSTTMLIQSDPSIDQLLATDISQNLQRIIDRVIVYGKNTTVTAGNTQTGFGSGTFTAAQFTDLVGSTANQFAGILNSITPETPTGTVTNGKAIDVSDIAKLMALLDVGELPSENRYFLLSSNLFHKLSTTLEFSSSGSMPIGRSDMTVRGYPTIISNLIVSNRTKGTSTNNLGDLVYFHAPSYGLVDFYNGIEIMSNPYSEFSKGIVQVRAMCYMGSFKRYSTLAKWYNQCQTAIS